LATGFGFKRLWAHFTYDRSIGFGLEYIGLTTLRYPRAVAIAVLLFSILCFSQLPKASVDGDLLRVYADSGEHYDAYKRLADTFGTFENDIYVLVNSPRLTDPVVLEQVRNLAFDLELNEYATGTMSPFTLRKPNGSGGTVPSVPEGMTDFAQVAAALSDLQQNDPMMRNLITPDLTGVVLIMFPNPCQLSLHPQTTCDQDSLLPPEQRGTKAMIQSLRDTIAPYQSADLTVELTGPPVWTSEMLNAAVDDQIKFTVWGFGLGALIALLALRSLVGALIVAATPFLAVMWTMGMVLLFFGSFSFLTIIVTTLVLVISFAESMFFVFNWLAYWRDDGMEPNQAVDATVKLVGPATSLTMLTTLVSFASLAFTSGKGILEFSIAGSLGCFLLFACLMTFMPLLLKFAIRRGFKAPKRSSLVLTAPLPLAWFIARRYGRLMSIVAIVGTVLLLIPYVLIKPHFSFVDFIAKDSTAISAAEEIDAGVGGVAPLYIRVPLKENDPNVGPQDFETIKKVHEILESELGQNKVISAAAMSNYTDTGFTREEVLNAVGKLKSRFVTEDGSEALVTGFMPTIIDSEDLKALVARIDTKLEQSGIEGAEIGGFRIMTTFATDQIVRGLQLDLTMSVLVNLALIGFAFQSFRVALASAIPNLFPVLGTEAWLYFSGQGLQLTTVIALTIAFGIAVDDTVHFLSHYLHSRREEGHNHMEAVKHTLDRIGGAIVATTIILCSGTVIVAFSALPQVALFGTLFVITLALAVLGDLFILPSLLAAGGKFFHPLGRLRVRTADHESTPDDPTGDTKTDMPHPKQA
jgi:predicted RND superfamily exporter protein